ncbi:hypothetical protein TVAG_149840 [Trichomonas vaginalis G3]|uniref:Outer dense fiber protein 3 n=1 Tax=Trichomonas vaginalis (strain ATCC PRA-98 / G3) TaxID=412133 RepID=A2FIL5_TRIV3|nr:hypothetical protein TVAG_149840 [Trichomonas vaginalis G3]|eukprot:XP_001308194.1 hypothetical protein [Trichomonas vaginalis G3]
MEEENEGPVKIPILLTSSAVMQGPGPGAYDTRGSIDRIAPIKIKGRYQEKVDSSAPPYVMLPSTIGSGRKCVFSGRPKDSAIESSPGPCYAPPAFGSDVPGCKIAHRTEDSKREITPGPGEYDTTRREKIKGGSFHGPHERSLAVTSTSPGPGAYAVKTDYMFHSPRMPIGTRHYDRATSDSPGPGEYDTRISAIKAKKYGGYIGNRTEIRSTETTP